MSNPFDSRAHTTTDAAREIVSQMSREDMENFDRNDWWEGVSNMQEGGWEYLDTSEILDEMKRLIAEELVSL